MLFRSALISILALCFAGGSATAADHSHSHDHAGSAKLELNAGRKWQTDAPLRKAMEEINGAMSQAVPRIHRKQFGDADYQALAAKINGQVAYMVENCKLDAKADAMLHLVVAELVAGAEGMEGKGGSRHDGAVRVLHALADYGKYFQHLGWKATRG